MTTEPGTKPISTRSVLEADESLSTASQEMITRTPGIILRGPIYVVFIILFGSLLYSIWAEVSVRIHAPLILTGEEYIVQSPISGVVSEVMVTTEERVATGSRILLLESHEGMQLLDQMEQLLEQEKSLKRQFVIEDRFAYNIEQTISGIANRAPDMTNEFLGLMENRENLTSLIPATDQPIELTSAETKELRTRTETTRISIETALRDVELQRESVQRIRDKYEIDQILLEQRLITKIEMMNSKSAYENTKAALSMAERNLHETILNQARQILTTARELKTQMENLETQTKQTGGILAEIDINENYCSVFSHYSGLVTNIEVFQGQRIGAGAPLAHIVRDNKPPVGKMYIANQDIGNVNVGQVVRIKYNAYPYQEYGVQSGRIIRLSGDVQEVAGMGLVYEADVALNSYYVSKGTKKIPLRLGVRGMAEVVTGKKKMIELVFAPVSKLMND